MEGREYCCSFCDDFKGISRRAVIKHIATNHRDIFEDAQEPKAGLVIKLPPDEELYDQDTAACLKCFKTVDVEEREDHTSDCWRGMGGYKCAICPTKVTKQGDELKDHYEKIHEIIIDGKMDDFLISRHEYSQISGGRKN